VGTGIHYPVPIHLQPAYRGLAYQRGDFLVSEKYARRVLSLPMYAELTPQLIAEVAEAIHSFTASRNGHKAPRERHSNQVAAGA
jgi:dTDP-4-amino-4,6-dideoxygalactose transaminase